MLRRQRDEELVVEVIHRRPNRVLLHRAVAVRIRELRFGHVEPRFNRPLLAGGCLFWELRLVGFA
jgi:hypothetical protein